MCKLEAVSTSILWLRRDLRLHDHPALVAALASSSVVVPVFCFDPRLLHGRHRSAPRTQFLLECLRELDDGLRRRGSRLIVRLGRPEDELPAVARSVGAGTVFATDDAGPFARRRDAVVRRALSGVAVSLITRPGMFVADDPSAIRTGQGGPYAVFTPYHRAWLRAPRREVLSAPSALPEVPGSVESVAVPTIGSLGLADEPAVTDAVPGGESAGRAAMERFIARGLDGYEHTRDQLGEEGTSRLSPYLHFGCVSARELEERLPVGTGADGGLTGADAFRRQLCWRDFYAQVLMAFPRNARTEYQAPVPLARSAGAARSGGSTPGGRARPDIRSSTRRCASSAGRVGCTTVPAWWSARS